MAIFHVLWSIITGFFIGLRGQYSPARIKSVLSQQRCLEYWVFSGRVHRRSDFKAAGGFEVSPCRVFYVGGRRRSLSWSIN